MTKPKLSIIVPVYNTSKYLPKCLTSIVKQTLQDIEIICVNDGSTDNSLEILKNFASRDSRIKVIDKANEGQSIARNIAIKQAQGEFLGFVDSDDFVDKDYFEKLYNAAKDYNCDMACAGFRRFEICIGKIKKRYKKYEVLTDIVSKINADKVPSHNYIWNKIYRRDRWNIEFPQGRYFEDMAVIAKILYNMGSMVTVPDTYYYYRKNLNSTIYKKTPKRNADIVWAENELYSFAAEHNIPLKKRPKPMKREYIKLFNLLTIFKIHYKENKTICKLFGFIPFLTKVTRE